LQPAAHPFPNEATDALATLRRATRAQHDRIDALMDLRRMQDRAHYARVLGVCDAFLAGWEPTVAAALPARWQPWLRARSRRPFLQQDLHRLGVAPGAPARIPSFAGPASAWGSVYVMEGSALGGQFITRNLAEAGLHPQCGAAYFHGWGDATGAMWREARAILARELDSDIALAHACASARLTFDTLSGLLEDCLHERAAAA
jgi:heme oxygenase (biliverdin-IX-beta and delta-forming)